jgi:hypothetical protein
MHLYPRVRLCLLLAIGLACWQLACAQDPSVAPQPLPADIQQLKSEITKPVPLPCIQPAPLVGLKDYNGPLKKTVGIFARALERKSVHPPHYKPGLVLCSLGLKDKFVLFVQDSLDAAAFLETGFWAGMDQASNRDRGFGQGAQGYGKRFGADFAGQSSSRFLTDFAYPSIFSEDPRYYRLAEGRVRTRFIHAVGHAFVAHRVNGASIPNYSEWLGTVSAVTLSNTYHPGNERGVGPVAESVGFSVLQDMGFDVLREFWPEISRKLNLPFRGEHEVRVAKPDSIH